MGEELSWREGEEESWLVGEEEWRVGELLLPEETLIDEEEEASMGGVEGGVRRASGWLAGLDTSTSIRSLPIAIICKQKGPVRK